MAKRKTTAKRRPIIVSVSLPPEGKAALDKLCNERGMTIKSLLGRLITWFVSQDKTAQAITLGQIEAKDVKNVAELMLRRGK